MKVTYLGPMDQVRVEPFGLHRKGEIKEYPDDFARELLATSVKQRFEGEETLESKTVPELIAMLEEKGVEVPPKARKADLIKMLEAEG